MANLKLLGRCVAMGFLMVFSPIALLMILSILSSVACWAMGGAWCSRVG